MHQAVIDSVNEQRESNFAGVKARRHQTRETGHGREEARTYIQMPVPEDLPGLNLWAGLKSIGAVVSECVRDGKTTDEVRYFISSLGVDVKRFAHAVRSHWRVENACHWGLDITYREDESRVRARCLGENLGWLYRFTLSLLKQHPGRQSLVMRRRCRGWDENFLLEALAGAKL